MILVGNLKNDRENGAPITVPSNHFYPLVNLLTHPSSNNHSSPSYELNLTSHYLDIDRTNFAIVVI